MARSNAGRLTTWKEIAAYLGRDERTAKRWEAARGLPVHRPPGPNRATVFAYAAELDAWLSGVGATREADAGPRRTLGMAPRLALGALAAVALVAGGLAWRDASLRRQTVAHPAEAPPPELYAKGLYAFQTRTRQGLSEAVADFSQVILKDPKYAPAYAALADCYSIMPEFAGMPAAQAYPQAKVAAERALALDSRLPGPHRALAFLAFWWEHDVARSKREFESALALDPQSALTHLWYANTLVMVGDFKGALAHIDRAEQLDPAMSAIMADKAVVLFDAGRAEEAITLLKTIEAAQPEFASAHSYLATIYLDQGDAAAGIEELGVAARLQHSAAEAQVAKAAEDGYRRGGVATMRQAILAQQAALFREGGYSPYALAQSYASSDPDRAFALLRESQTRGESIIMAVRGDPELRPLHDDPRFATMLASLHLPALTPRA